MKTFIFYWLVFQLLVAGVATVIIHNEIIDGEFICAKRNIKHSVIEGIVLPLIVVIPDTQEVIKYCK
jgi:hypothetical protein